MNEHNSFLTLEEIAALNMLLVSRQVRIDDPLLEQPESASKPDLTKSLLVLEQEGWIRLSERTRRLELERLTKQAKLRTKRSYKSRGRRHHRAKAAVQRRRRERTWATNPLVCILNMNKFAAKRIDQELFYRHVNPLWGRYDPKYLRVEFPRSSGTRANPWTVYNMTVKFKNEVIYRGEDQLLYDLSDPLHQREDNQSG